VLEAMPADLGAEIAKELQIPTDRDRCGKWNGRAGARDQRSARAQREGAEVREGSTRICGKTITTAVEGFVADVETGAFPDEEHTYS
jgi:ketopantoate hydroxymethyltransferase